MEREKWEPNEKKEKKKCVRKKKRKKVGKENFGEILCRKNQKFGGIKIVAYSDVFKMSL